MEKTPLLLQKSSSMEQKAPVASIAVPLGTPNRFVRSSSLPPAASSSSSLQAGLEPVRFSDHHQQQQQQQQHHHHHQRNQTEYTWIGSILSRMDSRIPQEHRRRVSKFFPSNMSAESKMMLLIGYIALIVYSILIFVGPLVLAYRDEAQWCPLHELHHIMVTSSSSTTTSTNNNNEMNGAASNNATSRHNWVVRHYGVIEHVDTEGMAYSNPDHDTNPCRYIRLWPLLGLTLEECDMSRRMVVSVILGGAIGFERRSADRPAGIRTMALVALGSCVFTVGSILAFQTSTMGWDASRVTAALPSGIGFLGGALIWKGTIKDSDGQDRHQVHGLTTAASLWLSAAVGVGAGGALYVVTTYSTILVLLVLRYGPKIYDMSSSSEPHEDDEADPQHDKLPETTTAEVTTASEDMADHPLGQQSENSMRRGRRRSVAQVPPFTVS